MGRATSIIVLLVLSLALATCEAIGVARPQGRAPITVRPLTKGLRRPGEKSFNVLRFGARPGGQADCTQAFMSTWVAACANPGPTRVVVPAGVFKVAELIFNGPCKGPSPTIFQVVGTIKADSDLSNYPNKGWISFNDIDGLFLTGDGTIDAQGQNVWQFDDCKSNPSCAHLPATLYINKIQNSKIRGVHLLNSMGFHMHVTNSYNLNLNALTITAPATSPNTDGIHISKSQTVNIGRSAISTGDDCISIGQGASNITINKVTCGPGHGISVGSLGKLANELDVRGVSVKNCTFTGTTNGVRIKTYAHSPPSRASGLIFSNIVMNNVQNPIIIDQFYGGSAKSQPSRVKISDVFYQNIRGTTTSPVAVNLVCSSIAPCDNVHLTNINLKLNGLNARAPFSSVCSNARAIYTGLQLPPRCR